VLRHGITTLVFVLVFAWTLLPRPAYPHNPTTTTVLFNREIAALLQRKCVQCHADGKLAMPLMTYAEARPWAEAIKEQALSRRMPPWPAERGFGAFSNDIGLTPREFEFLTSWIDGGVPEGTDPAPAFVDHGDHWTLGTPDVVASPPMPSAIDARSAPAFRRLTIDTGLTHDAWVRAIDFKPDPRVARGAFLSVAGTGQYLGGWTPWLSSTELPADAAFKLPAHARIAVDVMYSGASQAVSDTPHLALYFASAPAATPVVTTTLHAAADAKTPGRLVADFKATDARALVSMRPELPAGTRSLEIKLMRPDGSRDVLLWVKDAHQLWPTPYVFRKPVPLPAGSILQAVAYVEPASGADLLASPKPRSGEGGSGPRFQLAALSLVLTITASGWVVRTAGLHYQMNLMTFYDRNEWVFVDDWLVKQQSSPTTGGGKALVRQLREDALEHTTVNPYLLSPRLDQWFR